LTSSPSYPQCLNLWLVVGRVGTPSSWVEADNRTPASVLLAGKAVDGLVEAKPEYLEVAQGTDTRRVPVYDMVSVWGRPETVSVEMEAEAVQRGRIAVV
jgi:hypothetical protein